MLLLSRRKKLLGPNLSLSYASPLTIVRGEGAYLYDECGRAYLDCVNNVCHVGHCHPTVTAAAAKQMSLLNTNTRYLHPSILEYAEMLLARTPPPLDTVFMVCTGSEANELALRLARAHCKSDDVIVLGSAYHGNTSTLVDISPYKFEGKGGFPQKPWVHQVPIPDVYRGVHRGDVSDGKLGKLYGDIVGDVVRRVGPASFICESVLGCAGQVVLPKGYLKTAFAHVRAAGGVCISDEVQVGLGRVGSHFWAFETQGVVPDIVTLGKPVGNGFPLGVVICTRAIADSFNNGMEYFNTFGGSPVAAEVGKAVLTALDTDRLQANALTVGAHLLSLLGSVQTRFPGVVGDVRGLGLFVGVELVTDAHSRAPAPDLASAVAEHCVTHHSVLISTEGPYHNVLKMKPPICFSVKDAELLASSLECALSHCSVTATPTAKL